MTIPTSTPVRALNERLGNLETCADQAPERTFEQSKRAVEAVHECSNAILREIRARGFRALNDDRLRCLEAVLYGYLLEGNPDAGDLIAGEGFGAAMDGPARERVLAGILRDRDFIEQGRAAGAFAVLRGAVT